MLDTSYATDYDQRRVSIQRKRRPDNWAVNVIKNSGMPPDACSLYIELMDLPPKFEVNQRYVVNTGRYGGDKRVRRLFGDMIVAGKAIWDPVRDADGKYIRGVYRLTDERMPGGCEAVDNHPGCDEFKNEESAEFCGYDDDERRAGNRRPGIDNSIDNPDISKSAAVENSDRPCPTSQAEPDQGTAKASLSGSSGDERKNERSQTPAKGLSAKGGRQKPASETDKNRNIEQHRAQLIEAGGQALANPRATPGLWGLWEVIAWVAAGYDFDLDILPVIRSVSARHGLEPGAVRSWRYYTAAIRTAHYRRRGIEPERPPSKRAPRLDPYAPAPRDPDDGGTWQQVRLAAAIGQRRREGG